MSSLYTVLHAVLGDVLGSEFERQRGQVDSVDIGIRKSLSRENRKRAAARAQVKHELNGLRLLDEGHPLARPVKQRRRQQFPDEGPRHQCPRVGTELGPSQIAPAGQIGGGQPLFDPQRDAVAEQRLFARRQSRVGEGVEIIDRQMKAFEDQEYGLIERRR